MQYAPSDIPHQTVTEFIKVKTPMESIRIGFTEQKVSGHAGLSTFTGFLLWHRLGDLFAKLLPHRPTSPNALPPGDLAMGFITGILAGAQKLAHVAFLRKDVMLPSLLGIVRIGSQSTFTRFFQGFKSGQKNAATFGPLWRWCLERLPSRSGGYSLDLDSTRLLHEDSHQEGVAVGYTRLGVKPCLHPLLAVLEEVKLVVGFWLRPGNTSCANNVIEFTRELLGRMPHHLRLRVVRADSGFCVAEWLDFLELRGLKYIVVAKLLQPLQQILKKDLIWRKTEVPGTEVAEVIHQEANWKTGRRVVLIRHRTEEKIATGQRPGGKTLLDCPGYQYQALVTNLLTTVGPLAVWRDYNQRAGCEGVIKQLDGDFALPRLCLDNFWATEGALSLSVFSYNLCVLFQRHLGWMERVTASTLRFRLFTTGGIISQTGGITTIRLSVPEAERSWWLAVFDKILSLLPNCNAVGARPG
jgi:hypothetical protein